MQLESKPDFPAVQARWDAFWRGENTRPLVAAVIARPGVDPAPPPPYAAGYDGDYAPVVDQAVRAVATREYLGDAIPYYYMEFAAMHFAALLGADLHFRADGHGYGWAVPFVDDWDDMEISFRRDSVWWERTVAFAEALRRVADGRFLIAAPSLVSNLDALAALRGTERLLFDLVERPGQVHRALGQLRQAHADILSAFAELFGFSAYGSINRHGMYSTGRVAVPSCDFSCMISPAMFQAFAVPALRHEMALLDAVEYHLDGPDALKHLEALCALDKLDVVQWVPGDGRGQAQDWMWLYEKIDALGKGLILGATPDGIRDIWRRFRGKKLFFHTTVSSRDEFDRLLDDLERMPKR